MKRVYIICLLLTSAIAVAAQDVTYNHDQSVMNQFLKVETSTGSLEPNWYYESFHSNYKGWAGNVTYGKMHNRHLVYAEDVKEEGYADVIKDSLTKRMEIELLNIENRSPSGVEATADWALEKGKIQRQQQILSKSIQEILYYGGSSDDKAYWDNAYAMVQQSIDVTRDSYMPASKRKEQYILIYKDLCVYNTILNKLKYKWWSMRELKNRRDATTTFTRSRSVAEEAFGRWKTAWYGRGGNGSPSGQGVEAQ